MVHPSTDPEETKSASRRRSRGVSSTPPSARTCSTPDAGTLRAWLDGRELDDAALAAYLVELHDARPGASDRMPVSRRDPVRSWVSNPLLPASWRRVCSPGIRGRPPITAANCGPSGSRDRGGRTRLLGGPRRLAEDDPTARLVRQRARQAPKRLRPPAKRAVRVMYAATKSDGETVVHQARAVAFGYFAWWRRLIPRPIASTAPTTRWIKTAATRQDYVVRQPSQPVCTA